MKNVIKIDVNNIGYFKIENIDDGTNSIFIQFINFSSNAYCDIFYGDTYYEKLKLDENGLVEIPSFCYSDGSNMRFRYHNGENATSFIHIIGNANLYDDIKLKIVSNTICNIIGTTREETINNDKLKPATRNELGLVKVGSGLNIAKDGTLSLGDVCVKVDSILSDISENPVQNKVITKELEKVFQSVSNGKTDIAAAITDKGIQTAANDTFSIMSDNIRKISGAICGFASYIENIYGNVGLCGSATYEE